MIKDIKRIDLKLPSELKERLNEVIKKTYDTAQGYILKAVVSAVESDERKYGLTIEEESNSYQTKTRKTIKTSKNAFSSSTMDGERLYSILKEYKLKNYEFAEIAGFGIHIVTDILKDKPLTDKTNRKLEFVENVISAGDFLLEINTAREKIRKRRNKNK